jgi:hypothetical protein
MKKLLIVLFFAPLSIFAQNWQRIEENTRTFIDIGNQRHYVDDKYKVIQSVKLFEKQLSKIDTIPCIMLITECDDCNSKQVKGFRVVKTDIKPKGQDGDIYYIEERHIKTHIKYLDARFSELKPNFTVWLSH